LVDFVKSGCKFEAFTVELYRGITKMFGHVAVLKRDEFHKIWFGTMKDVLEWLEKAKTDANVKAPNESLSDVESEFILWLQSVEGEEYANAFERIDISIRKEEVELRALGRLVAKYPSATKNFLATADVPF